MDKGAHFYRCDLQVHTPRDQHWQGPHPTSEEDRRAYATRFIAACRAKGLHGVAITDHHDLAFVRYIRDAAKSEMDEDGNPVPPHRQIAVFPGIELTLSVPCQALLVFDADFPADLFHLVLTALAIDPSDASEPTTANVERLSDVTTLSRLREELDRHTFLRGRYIILPNVSDGGSDTLLRAGAAPKYREMPCVGGYLDGTIDQLGQGNQNILDGKASEYGNKRIALFQTSDNRRDDHKNLGRASTWIKWAVPSAEALRQACLAQESRVSQEQPRLPSVTIESMSVVNSRFLGPFELEFNPQYNALIGGRGTGKSTILEYLRWALCDQPPPSEEEDDTPNYLARRRRLIADTLRPLGATVEVRLNVHGVPHLIRRDSATGEILMRIGAHALEQRSEEDVRRLFPIQAYSQKQLSDVSVRVEELSRFIEGPVRSQLDGFQEQMSGVAEQIKEAYSMVRRRRGLSRTLDVRELTERSLSEQVDSLRADLAGLSDEDRALLSGGAAYSRADQVVDSWYAGMKTFRDGVERLQRTTSSLVSSLQSPADLPEEAILAAASGEYRSLLSDALAELDALLNRVDATAAAPESMANDRPWRQWRDRRQAFAQAYDAAVQRLSSHQERTDRLTALELDLQERLRETGRIREELRTLADVEAQHDALRTEWLSLIQQHDDVLDGQCARLTENSGYAIRARVERLSNTDAFVAALKSSISGSRVPGTKIDAIGVAIAELGPVDESRELCANVLRELEQLAEHDALGDGTAGRPDSPTLSKLGLTPANLDGIARRLNLDDWLTLSLTPIVSEPVFEYRSREEEYIPFHNASAGQQATALLKTLLNQDGPPLIVDQPEEDLDNQVILETSRAFGRPNRDVSFYSLATTPTWW